MPCIPRIIGLSDTRFLRCESQRTHDSSRSHFDGNHVILLTAIASVSLPFQFHLFCSSEWLHFLIAVFSHSKECHRALVSYISFRIGQFSISEPLRPCMVLERMGSHGS